MESIQAVANRIQERGLALASEKAQESILMEQYKELEQKEKAESKENLELKTQLLKTLRSRHGMELELYDLQQRIEKNIKDMNELLKEAEKEQAHFFSLKKQLDEHTTNIYARHRVEIDLFLEKMINEVREKEENRRKREIQLCELSLNTDIAREQANSLEKDKAELECQIRELVKSEEIVDEESASLSIQLKATMAKRASLRNALKEAQEMYRKANDEMNDIEAEALR